MNALFVFATLTTPLILPNDVQLGQTPAPSPETSRAFYPAGLPDEKKGEWSKYGMLEKTDLKCENGEPIYALKDGSETIAYVATKKGKTLVHYMGATICVFGLAMDSSKTNIRYVLASHIAVGKDVAHVNTPTFAVPVVMDEKQTEGAKAIRVFVSENGGKCVK